jgi:pilus assembly protein CpaF
MLEVLELLETQGATDLVVDGLRGARLLVDGRWRETAVPFATDREIVVWARELLESCGKRLDAASPYADAYVELGESRFRVHAVLVSGITARTQVSVRRHSGKAATLADLIALGRLTGAAAEGIRGVLARRESFLISGATGAGKTTLLAAALNEIRGERVIVIEDTPELSVSLPWVIGLTTREPNAEGVGRVTASDLVKQTLRMRPDRVTLGEVRGPEIGALLEALMSGHPGGGSTIHAGSLGQVAARLSGLLGKANLGFDAFRNLPELLPWVFQVARAGSGWSFEVGRFGFDARDRLVVERVAGWSG